MDETSTEPHTHHTMKGTTMNMKNRSGSSPPVCQSATKEYRSTPFKRGRSKVFYASDDNGPPKFPSQSVNFTNKDNSLPEKSNEYAGQEPAIWNNALDTCKEASEGNSSGDEAASPSTSSSIRSPIGSLRSSLGGSLRGSQDSGYSDSGESNSGGTQEADSVESPPRVKHISRVFFGGGSGRARLYSDTIVTNTSISSPISPPRSSESLNSLTRRQKSCSTQVESSDSYSSSRSSPTSICDSDEPQYQMENKSILDASTSSYDEQASRKTGAIRKSSYAGGYRKGPRRSSSAEKLIDETKHSNKRPCILKARRRWSAIDVKVQNLSNQSYNASRSMADIQGNLEYSSLGTVLEAPRKAVQSDQCLTNTLPRKANIKRLRIHPTAIATEMKNGSLSQWLLEVRYRSETECMNTLQSKSLASEPPLDPLSTVDAVRQIQRRAHSVSTEFARLCQKLEQQQNNRLPALSRSLVAHINGFLREPPGPSAVAAGPKSALCRQIEVVRQICHRLMEITTAIENQQPETEKQTQCIQNTEENITIKHVLPDAEAQNENIDSSPDSNTTENQFINERGNDTEVSEDQHTDDQKLGDDKDSRKEIAQVVTALGHAFTRLVDIMLSVEIKEVVACLEDDRSSLENVRNALRQVTSLGVDGGHICRLIAKLGGVRALLGLNVEPRRRSLRVAALRALATVCCVADGIAQLEKAGGIEVIVEILCDQESPEDEKSEASAVLAQITSPWVEDNHSIVSLHRHIAPVVTALTGLVKSTESAEIFLLGSAALANITFLQSDSSATAMVAAGTAQVLLQAAADTQGLSVFTKDQIATVIASLCSSKPGAAEVARHGGVPALVGLLATRPPPHPARMPEVTAAERVQQKSAIAISRLCCDTATSSEVLSLGGGARLVHLCKDEAERNHSDAVLVACLAALRKMASTCDREQLRDIDAAELVEPRLLDSFLSFSSRQESYV